MRNLNFLLMHRFIFGLIILLGMAWESARADLVFSGDAIQVSFGNIAAETGGCLSLCGPDTPCSGSYYISGTSASFIVDPPGGCVYCGCCREGAVFGAGVVRVILYVDPLTALPRSRFDGGEPVRYGIPGGSRIRFPYGQARADNCLQYGVSFYHTAVSVLAAGGSAALEHNDRSICDGGGNFEYANLSGNGLAFLTYNYVYGMSCSSASTSLDYGGAQVYVPGTSLYPDDVTKRMGPGLVTISVTNSDAQYWSSLQIRAFDESGAVVDSMIVASLAADMTMNWTTGSMDELGAVQVEANTGGRQLYATLSPEQVLYTPSGISSYLLVSDLMSKSAPVVKRCAGMWDRCRIGAVRASMDSTAIVGVSLEPLARKLRNVSDDFDDSILGDHWAIEVPCGGASLVSTSLRSGFLRIVASEIGDGAEYDTNANFCAPRVVQAVSGDWTLETRLEFDPDDATMAAGIMLNGQRQATRYRNTGSAGVSCLGVTEAYSDSVTYFRITKSGDQVTGYWSANGADWTEGGTLTMDVSCIALGAFRIDRGNDSSEHSSADFDYVSFDHVSAVPNAVPEADLVRLDQNFPNPFNPATEIIFWMKTAAPVDLRVFDMAGRLVDIVLSGEVAVTGRNSVNWRAVDKNGRPLPTGVYFYRLEAEGRTETKRMVLLN